MPLDNKGQSFRICIYHSKWIEQFLWKIPNLQFLWNLPRSQYYIKQVWRWGRLLNLFEFQLCWIFKWSLCSKKIYFRKVISICRVLVLWTYKRVCKIAVVKKNVGTVKTLNCEKYWEVNLRVTFNEFLAHWSEKPSIWDIWTWV